MPYISAQVDLFSRCTTLPPYFCRLPMNAFLYFTNSNSIQSALEANNTAAASYLARVVPHFQAMNFEDFRDEMLKEPRSPDTFSILSPTSRTTASHLGYRSLRNSYLQ